MFIRSAIYFMKKYIQILSGANPPTTINQLGQENRRKLFRNEILKLIILTKDFLKTKN